MRHAADRIKEELASYPGVIDIMDSFRGSKQQLEIEILPAAEALGLSQQDLGRQVRQAFYGEEAQRIQRGRDDVRVMVCYPAEERRSLGDVEGMRIRTRDGSAVPFQAVARATLGEGFASISRLNRKRIVNVTADVDLSVTNQNAVVAQLRRDFMPGLEKVYTDIEFSYEGEQAEQAEFLGALKTGWMMAMLVIYALLAIPLRSYTQPIIIMTAIPFGLIGATWGHYIMGHDFSMFSLIGLVALSGVVVNDSLVLVDRVNQERASGATLHQSLMTAGTTRFRAILLTSLTTFAGLTPLLLENSVQAKMLVPMGISLAFGVVFATFITLILVPAHYMILAQIIGWFTGTWDEREATGEVGSDLDPMELVDGAQVQGA